MYSTFNLSMIQFCIQKSFQIKKLVQIDKRVTDLQDDKEDN